MENHVTGMILNEDVGICGSIIHKVLTFTFCVFRTFGLLTGYLFQSRGYGKIKSPGMKKTACD